MGVILAAILILALIFYAAKDLLKIPDLPMWINIFLATLILFTITLAIFIILNKAPKAETGEETTAPVKTEETAKEEKPAKQQVTPKEELSDDDIMLLISKEFLTLKKDYEQNNNGKDGTQSAVENIIQKYGFTKEEWDEFYKDAVNGGYLERAAQDLTKETGVNYLIAK